MRDNSIKVLEEVTFAAPKTKDFINVFNALGLKVKSIIRAC
jgi:large subunit ribosomal protein L4